MSSRHGHVTECGDIAGIFDAVGLSGGQYINTIGDAYHMMVKVVGDQEE
jgi:hypothetical protein